MTTYPIASSASLVQQAESLAAQLEFTQFSQKLVACCTSSPATSYRVKLARLVAGVGLMQRGL
ncbi:hypothetical protein [Nostoc sp. LPT]|uniref:hypothetical protein n=1 Tax=Nostoc sp. LPT TaxID=2815387 RepID=UPI001E03B5F3|nr:hypothetical protein [Nostoc sp. LPT]MBN4007101.1 hypothetical protein [Nostoc sp. LPT]